MSDENFFEISVNEVVPDVPLPFAVYVRAPEHARLIPLHRTGDVVSRERHRRYRVKRIDFLWVRNEDKETFHDYQSRWQIPSPQTSLELLRAIISSEVLWQERESQTEAARVVRRILSSSCPELPTGLAEIWDIAAISPFPGHGLRVATYAVLFAMAFEHLDPSLLADLALAGLLHDVGRAFLPRELVTTPTTLLTPQQLETYQTHVAQADRLIGQDAPRIPARVRGWIAQHHERFDGSGYPARSEGYQVQDMAQLLAAADILDDLANGSWDGKRRSVRDALACLLGFERALNFPQYFNPDIFTALKRWTQDLEIAAA